MPTHFITFPAPQLTLGIWHISESVSELSSRGRHLITGEWNALKGDTRRREWLAGRMLLQEMAEAQGIPFGGIEKDHKNKPFLIEKTANISLSHTQNAAAACLHPSRRVGVDIEFTSPRVSRIASKFLNEEEKKATASNWEQMLVYWCAKEALYKLQDHRGVAFKEELLIEPGSRPGSIKGMVRTQYESIDVWFWVEQTQAHTIVCALEQ